MSYLGVLSYNESSIIIIIDYARPDGVGLTEGNAVVIIQHTLHSNCLYQLS